MQVSMKIYQMLQIALLCMVCNFSVAGSSTVFLGKNICTKSKSVCVKGTMQYHYSKGLLTFHGRVKKTTKPGVLVIRVQGISKDNEFYSAYFQANLRGKYSEIIDIESDSVLKNRRDIKWKVRSVSYGS